MLSLYALLKAGLLLLNALAILHPGRFLRLHGLEQPGFDGGVKDRVAQTLAWTRGLRSAWCPRLLGRPAPLFHAPITLFALPPSPPPLFCAVPLVITNCLVVVVELLFG